MWRPKCKKVQKPYVLLFEALEFDHAYMYLTKSRVSMILGRSLRVWQFRRIRGGRTYNCIIIHASNFVFDLFR